MASPERCFADLLASDPSRPFVTYYDETTGERSELSARSLANWVAKTHFLLVDELGLGAGDTALIALPAHWISVTAVLGCLTAGLALDDGGAAVAFVDPGSAALADGVPDVFAVAPASAAAGFGDAVPDGVSDYVVAVRPQADAWASVRFGATDGDPAVARTSRGELVEQARARAGELGVATGARVLTGRDWTDPADWLDTLFVPLVMGGSVVYVRGADDQTLTRRMQQERATVRV